MKRILSLLLSAVMVFGAVPPAVYAEQAGEQGETVETVASETQETEALSEPEETTQETEESSVPEADPEESIPETTESTETAETKAEEKASEPVEVSFLCEPANLHLTVKTEAGETVQPGETCYLLMPGFYTWSAELEGYEPRENVSFEVSGESAEIPVVLQKIAAPEEDQKAAPEKNEKSDAAASEVLDQEETETLDISTLLGDPDELLKQYLEQPFYENPQVSLFGTFNRDLLNERCVYLYDVIGSKIKSVARGETAIARVKFGGTFSSADLGVPYIWSNGSVTQNAKDALTQKFPIREAVTALLLDMPYDCYWLDKVTGWNWSIHYRGDPVTVTYTLNIAVSPNYANMNGQRDSYGHLIETDLQKTGRNSRAAFAASNARAVVEQNAALGDYDKLCAYRDYICREVSYNYDALGEGIPYGDPWQLINAFDEDPNTNIVCEGYSKAFQYLCDLSTFQGDVICHQDIGDTSGPHMWNAVQVDDVMYLVDVTNSDAGTIGQNGGLFLVPVSYDNTGFSAGGVHYSNFSKWPADKQDMLSSLDLSFPWPKSGQEPMTEVIGNGYKIQITWEPSCSKFAPDTVYTAELLIKPMYAPFDQNISVSFEGVDLEAESDGFNLHTGVIFPKTEGSAKKGWVKEGSFWTYYRENGTKPVGAWEKIGNRWYYFNGDGYIRTQWARIGSYWYYFGYDGAMRTGWQKISGRYYYFEGSGHMAIGWKKLSGSYYYMDGSGAMVTGWKHIGSKDYYFTSSGAMAANQWIGNYYVGADGAWVQNAGEKAKWVQNGIHWCYVHPDGSFTKNNFEKIGASWYYFDASGYMVTGRQQIGGKDYCFESSGRMVRGWKQVNGVYYYYDGSGAMVRGWKHIGSKDYYFNASGAMAVNQWVGSYYVGADGAWVPGKKAA